MSQLIVLIITLFIPSLLLAGCNSNTQVNNETLLEATSSPLITKRPTIKPNIVESTQEISDQVGDGTYTNYTHGFRFNYNPKFFKSPKKTTVGYQFYSTDNIQDSEEIWKSTVLQLEVSGAASETIKNQLINSYTKLKNANIKETNQVGLEQLTLLNRITKDGVVILEFTSELVPGAETKPAWVRSVIFEKDSTLVRISIVDLQNHDLTHQKNLIDSIIKSLSFFDSKE